MFVSEKTHPGYIDLFDVEHLFLSDVSISQGTCRCKLSTPLYINHFVGPLGGQIIVKAPIEFSNTIFATCKSFFHLCTQ